MKLAIMQPYFFPFLGYFQLLSSVDSMVLHDDVQWIKGGWINRNRILVEGSAHLLTVPLESGSSLSRINQRRRTQDTERVNLRLLRQIDGAYSKAPFFQPVRKLVSECLSHPSRELVPFLLNSLRQCCDQLGIHTPLHLSSALGLRDEVTGQDRVLEICARVGADHYINPIGGQHLYRGQDFEQHGIALSFLRPGIEPYPQMNDHAFVPSLSIIDVMMFNSQKQLVCMLNDYNLEQGGP